MEITSIEQAKKIAEASAIKINLISQSSGVAHDTLKNVNTEYATACNDYTTALRYLQAHDPAFPKLKSRRVDG